MWSKTKWTCFYMLVCLCSPFILPVVFGKFVYEFLQVEFGGNK